MIDSRLLESLDVAGVAIGDCRERTELNRQAEQHASKLIAIDLELLSRSRESLAESYVHLQSDPAAQDRCLELAHLRQADRHIAVGRVRIDRQRRLIRDLRGRNCPTALAEALLETMLACLKAMESHRLVIRQRLGLVQDADSQPP